MLFCWVYKKICLNKTVTLQDVCSYLIAVDSAVIRHYHPTLYLRTLNIFLHFSLLFAINNAKLLPFRDDEVWAQLGKAYKGGSFLSSKVLSKLFVQRPSALQFSILKFLKACNDVNFSRQDHENNIEELSNTWWVPFIDLIEAVASDSKIFLSCCQYFYEIYTSTNFSLALIYHANLFYQKLLVYTFGNIVHFFPYKYHHIINVLMSVDNLKVDEISETIIKFVDSNLLKECNNSSALAYVLALLCLFPKWIFILQNKLSLFMFLSYSKNREMPLR